MARAGVASTAGPLAGGPLWSTRKVGAAFVVAALAACMVLYVSMHLRHQEAPPLPDIPKKTVPAVTHVYVGHIVGALEDITGKQPLLCSKLYELQAYLRNASESKQVNTELVAYNGRINPPAKFSFDKEVKLSASGVVLTSHFISLSDPLYANIPGREGAAQDVFGYMDLWYRTLVGTGLPAVVFHDLLSSKFVDEYTTEFIKFIKVDISSTHYSSNDVRFDIFSEWLKCCCEVDYVLFTDIRDVRFARDPFQLMRAQAGSYDLFMNTDRNNPWMQNRFKELAYKRPDFEVLFNAGVWGGKKEAVMDVLGHMLREFARLYQKFYNVDDYKMKNFNMAVFNMAVIHYVSRGWRIFTGHPFVAGQAQCELFFQCDYYVYHKYAQPGELPPCTSLLDAERTDESPMAVASGGKPDDPQPPQPVWQIAEMQPGVQKLYPWQALARP